MYTCSAQDWSAARDVRFGFFGNMVISFPSGNIGTVYDCPVPGFGKIGNLRVRKITIQNSFQVYPYSTCAPVTCAYPLSYAPSMAGVAGMVG